MGKKVTDAPTPGPEDPIPIWPPAPLWAPPVPAPKAGKRPWETLTPHKELDLLLGLPAGLLGAVLLSSLIVVLATPLDAPPEIPPVEVVPSLAGFCGSIVLGAAACAVLLRRRTVFGVAVTVGAVTVWAVAGVFLWLA